MNLLDTHINSLCIYKDLLNDNILKKLTKLIQYINSNEKLKLNTAIYMYNDFSYELLKQDISMNLKAYILHKVIFQDNFIADNQQEVMDDSILLKAKSELKSIYIIANISSREIKETLIKKCKCNETEVEILNNCLEWNANSNIKYKFNDEKISDIYKEILSSENWGEELEKILNIYNKYGTGDFALCRAFVWENNSLRKVEDPDNIKLDELIGYEWQKEIILENTLKFIKGYAANNILLYGSRGTGKSSTVKALANEYYRERLRLIQVDKEQLVDFPKIINVLKNKRQKFIIFVDDLVFQENEPAYSALKTILEGKIENRPKNILIYATSNRKHLVKETFSDRQGMGAGDSEEIHPKDTMEEKLSLADRFGITVTFISPSQKEFLNIVDGIVKNRGINVEEEYLHKEALKWERTHNGRSPRTATQFVDWLEGE